ncbi:MAG TPA: crotonase/enoyl-CoA hydratase family protein [Acidimicrobiales bacterium]|nr:crotonase/enoyl-CoA hydratase family protein [Acidimicrobiales bacterium]
MDALDALVTYETDGPIATITMDDGKVNVLSPRMLTELEAAFDRAAADRAVVVLRGREGVFSAGFDLAVLNAGGSESLAMVRAGFELAERVLSFPTPVVIACTGHAVAMGVFLVLSGDHRIGAAGPFRLTANEVAIGLTMPRAAVEICRQRLTPAHFNRAVVLAEPFTPAEAVEAGFLDRVVDPASLDAAARTAAEALATLDMASHVATKQRARGPALDAIRAGIAADWSSFRRSA